VPGGKSKTTFPNLSEAAEESRVAPKCGDLTGFFAKPETISDVGGSSTCLAHSKNDPASTEAAPFTQSPNL